VLKLSRGDVKTAKRAARQLDPETLPVIEEGEKVISATATLRCLLQGGLRAAFRDRGEKAWSSYRKEKEEQPSLQNLHPSKTLELSLFQPLQTLACSSRVGYEGKAGWGFAQTTG
jgi:hypothetical protein